MKSDRISWKKRQRDFIVASKKKSVFEKKMSITVHSIFKALVVMALSIIVSFYFIFSFFPLKVLVLR